MTNLRYKWTRLLSSTAEQSTALARSSHALAVLDSKLYIVTGELKPRTPVPADLISIELGLPNGTPRTLSASGSSWPSPRVGSAMTPAGNSLYLWGGRGGKDMGTFSSEEDLWRFDTISETWESLKTTGDKPEQRSFHVMTTAKNGSIYLHAGCPSSGRLASLHALDLSTLKWTQKADAPGPGRGGTVLAVLADSRLLRFAGFAGKETEDMAVYSTENDTWTSISPEAPEGNPEARSVHSLVGLPGDLEHEGRKVVAVMSMGERVPTAKEVGHDGAGFFHQDVWAVLQSPTDPNAFSWLPLSSAEDSAAPGPEPRGWFPSSLWKGNKVVLQGGLNERNERLSDAWILEVVQE